MDESDIPTVSEAFEVETNVIVEEIAPSSNQSEEIIDEPLEANVIENLNNLPSTSKQGAEKKIRYLGADIQAMFCCKILQQL